MKKTYSSPAFRLFSVLPQSLLTGSVVTLDIDWEEDVDNCSKSPSRRRVYDDMEDDI